ncbi:MAG TPA: RagB/SusD family nutrient uptake outer membrane protein, partial [Chitinophagaceae bacterium]|nr:RagB/SusD family nutrient uptake outer membrane protein [Chitinophagaceae bacterium]
MKLKHIIPAVLVILAGFSACKKIEVKPTGQVPPAEAIKNEADLLANLNATYTPLRGDNFWGGKAQTVSELMADIVDGTNLTGDYLSIYRLGTTGTTGTISSLYSEPYVIIYRANVTLEKLSLIANEAARNNAEGQARFIRALSYFELVKMFAQPYGYTADNSHRGVVVKTTSEPVKALPRNSVKQAYDLILDDLKKAEALLPPENGNYPTSWAAKAILARVYFQM